MSFKHPTCGGTHETVRDARICEGIERETHQRADQVAAYMTSSDDFERSGGAEPGDLDKRMAAAPPRPARVEQDGIYHSPETGEIWKVQWNVASGDGSRLYAKIMVMTDPETGWEFTTGLLKVDAEIARRSRRHFEYAPGAMRSIRPEWRMSFEDAQAFGALYGRCMKCGRELTAEESIERAMGPICANKSNWG